MLSHAAEWINRPQGEPKSQSKFLDLAPTDQADEAGVYATALSEAMDNPRVFNIALTGPYGSGKSSIIRSFLKKYRIEPLQISLAAFLPESDANNVEADPDGVEFTPSNTKGNKKERDKATKQEIERSILQQMLHGADANKLPFSRFKRIQTPGKWSSRIVSTFISLGLFAWWHLYQNRDAIVDGDYFVPLTLSNWFNLISFALGGALLWLCVHRVYVASFGVSLKSLSLKDIQLTPAAIDQESILNRHLDEIIYFFQSTKYELVIIEDLDRFNDPEIFVTLREINKIVNENSGVKRTIRFLYALRDDMFVNTDRTKFFEFIIPVIPIINSSNSIDMVIKEGTRLSLDDRLDRQFLREVSRYLSDLRLIRNIFNEYAIYADNLKTDDENVWNANKLLAVLIYKNIFPRDFEMLHRGNGKLAQILGRHGELIAHLEEEYKAEIFHIEEQIQAGERQLPENLEELRDIYAMALIQKLPEQANHIEIAGIGSFAINSLSVDERIDNLISTKNIIWRNQQTGHQGSINVSGFEREVDALKTFAQRKEEIEHKSAEFKKVASKNVRELRAKIASLRLTQFHEIIRQNATGVEELFKAFGDNSQLARFLILEGHLDDTYYHYTSLFHAGRLSPNDNKFLMQIRGYTNPDPDFQIDNPKEVIAAMRDEDFSQSYVLNVKIVDCLLNDPAIYTTQTTNLFEFIASDFDKCEEFFSAYYASGIAVTALISGLVKNWTGFVPAAMSNTTNLQHMAHIIACLPTTNLAALPSKHPDLSEFVSANLQKILVQGVDFEPSRLKLLQIEVTDLTSIEGYSDIARFVFEEGLYHLTIDNLDFIFRVLLGKENEQQRLHKQHYTTILQAGNATLSAKIERSFADYLENVLLRLEHNTQESIPAILSVIRRDELTIESLKSFLEKQSALIPALDQVPARLHATLFELEKIEASWENCLAFFSSETCDLEILTDYLNNNNAVASLSRLAIPDSEQALALCKFLIENDSLDDDAYASYMGAVPEPFQKFPEDVSWDKLHILIDQKKISFSCENLAFLSEDSDFQILFVEKNIDRYLEVEDACESDDDFRERLLGSDIQDEQKLQILKAMDLASLASLPSRAAKVGPILVRTGAEVGEFGVDAAIALIIHSRPIEVQIQLLNKFQQNLDDQQVKDILTSLQKPFSDIKPGYGTPRIKNTPVNLELVRWLEARRFISSWSEGGWLELDKDIRINLRRK